MAGATACHRAQSHTPFLTGQSIDGNQPEICVFGLEEETSEEKILKHGENPQTPDTQEVRIEPPAL